MKEKTPDQKELDRAENLGEVLDNQIRNSEIPPRLEIILGICVSCTNCHYQKTKLEDEKYICERLEYRSIKLKTNDPIIQCSGYSKRGEMSLWEMKEMATLIDAGHRTPGFKLGKEEDETK